MLGSSGTRRRRAAVVAAAWLLVGVAGAAAGCGEDEGDPTTGSRSDTTEATEPESSGESNGCRSVGGSSEPPETTVQLTLGEYAIVPTSAEIPAGTAELVASNGGTIPHELAIYRFDGDPATLPVSFVGGVDESQLPSDAVLGRIRWIEPTQSCTLAVDLTPGRYLLICNLVDDGSNPHYAHGMYTTFTVT